MSGRVLVLVLLGMPLLLGSTAVAEPVVSQRPTVLSVSVGFGGHYRTGVWTPVALTLRGGSQATRGQLSLIVADSDGAPSRVSTPADQPVELAAGQTRSIGLYVRFGRLEEQIVAEYRAGEGKELLASRVFRSSATPGQGEYPVASPSTWRLVGSLGAGTTGVEQAIELLRQQPAEQAVAVALESAAALPDRWYGYESLEGLVLSASKPEMFSGLKPDGPQIIALDKWVRMGGKLVLAVGSQAERMLGKDSPLARFSPGKLQQMVVLRQSQANALEAYTGSSAVPIPRGSSGRLEIHAPQLQDVRGTVEVRDGNLPLVIRRAWGLGQVVFVAADLDAGPLADWQSRGLLVGRLLDLPVASGNGELEERGSVMHYGFTDMSGQLRSALDQYADVWPISFSLVAGLVIIYGLLIGPVDYFLLRKLSPRMELTWVTFPLVIVAFSVGAYVLAHRFKGDEVRTNQVSLIDVDAESKWLRGVSWANVFSPRMGRYELSSRPGVLGKSAGRGGDAMLAWMGTPGGALGGMDPTTASPAALEQPYDFGSEPGGMRGVPIPVWASKSFTSRWSAPDGLCPEASLANEEQVVTGRIINTLGFPLRDCVLIHSRWAYELGTVEPGQIMTVGPTSPRRELRTMMTGRRLVFEETTDKYQQETTPYDPSSVDLAYILRMMMFFDAAGGRGYTGLVNRYQNFVDLTSLLKADRAILVAVAPEDSSEDPKHGSVLLENGKPVRNPKDRRLTMYRFVYPLGKAK